MDDLQEHSSAHTLSYVLHTVCILINDHGKIGCIEHAQFHRLCRPELGLIMLRPEAEAALRPLEVTPTSTYLIERETDAMERGTAVNTGPEANVEEGRVVKVAGGEGKAKGERGGEVKVAEGERGGEVKVVEGERGGDDREGGGEGKVVEGERGGDDREGGGEVKVAEVERGGDPNASPEDWQTPPSSPPLRKEEEEENMEVDKTGQKVDESGSDSSSDEGQHWGWPQVSEQEREFP